ncbi:dienelactone hydrolase family protein [Myxococcus sp. CA033]|uniref:carboxylesterase family protein n=1 Tax=Myxococcus sp. CA033 TaxID=2741516 RepID=UPI00157A3443|nr:PHB depolymerase family esterase [Myxococcus sp. CA033]NTX36017.1 dienelactone hydrolase family protein [Myxococcus sp. CA033]
MRGFASLGVLLVGCGVPEDGGAEQALSSTASPLVGQKLVIAPAMVQPDGVRPTLGVYQNLYDEQALIGDPRAGSTFKPATTWGNVVYSETQYPMGFIIDLGQLHDVTEVGVFDTYDHNGSVSFRVGAPGAWTSTFTINTTLWETWQLVPVGQRTRYIHFARTMYGASNEIVIYGAPVGPPANVPPTASAGLDQTVVLPTSSAQLTGTASDSDGTVVSRQWTQFSGPNTATLTGANTLTATASGLVAGLYEFDLLVTDDQGATATSRTKVRVEPASTGRGTTTEIYRDTTSTLPGNYGYVVYLPPGYNAATNWPIVIFLHGAGERGDGGTNQLKRVRNMGLQSYIDKNGKDYPFILVSPQTSTSSYWNDQEALDSLNPFIERILSTYKVDRKRVYLTGLSMGGAGTFSYAQSFPAKLAAAVPVCNGGYGASAARAQAMVDANLPVWGSHAINDPVSYSGTREWFTRLGQAMGATGTVMDTYTYPPRAQTAFFRPALGRWDWVDGQTAQDANGNPPERPVLFTLFHDGGHEIWDRVYQDPKVLSWMLAQQRP